MSNLFSGLVLVACNSYNGSTENPAQPDVNGLNPVILVPVAGKCPNRTVLSGTVSKNAGFEVGKSYLAKVQETEPDATYGRRFTFTKLSEAGMMDIIQGEKALGKAEQFKIEIDEEPKKAASSTVFAGTKAKATAKS